MQYLTQFVQTCTGTHLQRMGHYTSTLLRWPTLDATCVWQQIRLGHNAREWICKYMVGGKYVHTKTHEYFQAVSITHKHSHSVILWPSFLISQFLLPSLTAAPMWRLQSTFRPPCLARPPAYPNPPSAGWKMVEPSILTRTRICTGWSRFSPSLFSNSRLKTHNDKTGT